MPIRPEMRARYPADWKLRSRFVRFVRARGRCEWCGVANHSVILRETGGQVAGPFESYGDARQWVAECYASRFGIEGDGPSPWSVVVLTTAHVYDDRPEAASLLNLAALCQKCHNGHDMEARRAGMRDRKRAHTRDMFA
jgi:hypothetical protein